MTPGLQDLERAWHGLDAEERARRFAALATEEAARFFLVRTPVTQAALLSHRPPEERRLLLRMLPPDDLADLMRQLPPSERPGALAALDERTRSDVAALLAYAEDVAGGRMNPRFVRLRPRMSIQEATTYTLKRTREQAETIHYLYVLDDDERLQGVLSLRELLTAPPHAAVEDVMRRDVLTVREDEDQEGLARLAKKHALAAFPVVSGDGRMMGIVTLDDVVSVAQAEATEDIQKLSATQALPRSYLQATHGELLRARAGWLVVLFLGEMLAAVALAHFEAELHAALILALFIPLIVASGGNAGAQATALVVRDMALGKLRASDLGRAARREGLVSLTLGGILAVLGAARILAGASWGETVPEDAARIALIIGVSLVLVVVMGSLVGTSLPFALRRLGFDPATASGPLVATLVDVAGVVTYFTVARAVL
ncbi:MAG TPA: magnesium transporter [Candidatus Thermoplasmatota archaeon]|nr:magnesium transporter [Candidatus Thermoplasmatota archaeon]